MENIVFSNLNSDWHFPHGSDGLLGTNTEDLLPRGSELWGHEAVEDEVDCTVGEGHHVHHLPHRVVALYEELLPPDGRQHAKYPL